MSNDGASAGALDIGRVIQETFAVLGRNFVVFLILAVILVGAPYAVLNLLLVAPAANLGTANFAATFTRAFEGGLFIGLLGLILQGIIIYATVSDLNGRPVSLADSLRAGLYAFLPMLLIGFLMGLAVGLGFILLIVPGIMLAVAWCVAIPVYVVERPGITAVFGRSAELTRGNRWRIFGLFCIYLVIAIIIGIVFAIVAGVTSVISLGGFAIVSRLIVTPLAQAASTLIAATGAAVLYVELRRLRDGVGPEGLAAVFD